MERCGCGFRYDVFLLFSQITWARQLLGVNTSYQILTIGDSTYIDDPRFLVDMSTVNYVSTFFTQLFLTALWRHSAYILLIHTFDTSTLLLYLPHLQDWSIKILRVEPFDSGTYKCQVNTHPPQYIATFLNIAGMINFIAILSGFH